MYLYLKARLVDFLTFKKANKHIMHAVVSKQDTSKQLLYSI